MKTMTFLFLSAQSVLKPTNKFMTRHIFYIQVHVELKTEKKHFSTHKDFGRLIEMAKDNFIHTHPFFVMTTPARKNSN